MEQQDKHQRLVAELVGVFQQHGFTILAADNVPGFPFPNPLPNDGYGDQEPKPPDVYAFDPVSKRYVIGEAKTGDNDLETEHSLTQYNVFLDQFDEETSRQARLYIILPAAKVAEFNTLITHYIHRAYWGSIVLVQSQEVKE
ncbi:MAG TPA: hypothetical protein VJN65_08300 [Bacteroidota bacterium]|nr:hypothetical protein [Bacteroidota bacterium]